MGSSLIPRGQQGSFAGLQRLNNMLDQMFGTQMFGSLPVPDIGATLTSAWLPPVDVFEDQNSVKIVAEIPGVDMDDLTLSLENNVLTLRGEKRQEREDRTDRVHRYERSYGAFERSFVLPATVDAEKIEANLDNGVLTITVPKAEKARPRQIEVRGSQGSKGQSGSQRSSAQVGGGSQAQGAQGEQSSPGAQGSATGSGTSGSSRSGGSGGRGSR
ncbi:MAG TPA: Hsp20/alpha crystallin family protein [Gemmatimonadales bacterium]|nr:Hsp20/alpha crystallin family protein [Gemmatimonadales bacterium]